MWGEGEEAQVMLCTHGGRWGRGHGSGVLGWGLAYLEGAGEAGTTEGSGIGLGSGVGARQVGVYNMASWK